MFLVRALIFSTLIALIVVVLIPAGGIRVSGFVTWILAAVIVWVVTAMATLFLPMIFVKKRVEDRLDAKR